MEEDKIRELKKIKIIENKKVKDRTETDHFYLIRFKYNRSIRNYLLSMGKFKDIPMKKEQEEKTTCEECNIQLYDFHRQGYTICLRCRMKIKRSKKNDGRKR